MPRRLITMRRLELKTIKKDNWKFYQFAPAKNVIVCETTLNTYNEDGLSNLSEILKKRGYSIFTNSAEDERESYRKKRKTLNLEIYKTYREPQTLSNVYEGLFEELTDIIEKNYTKD